MYYRILNAGRGYYPQYKRSPLGIWTCYRSGGTRTWKEAYAVLEKHANPARLAVCFVGTY